MEDTLHYSRKMAMADDQFYKTLTPSLKKRVVEAVT